MRNAVIVGFKRSPFTMARKGEMAEVRPEDILSQTINSLIKLVENIQSELDCIDNIRLIKDIVDLIHKGNIV